MPSKKATTSKKSSKTTATKAKVEDSGEIVAEECHADLNVELLRHVDTLTKKLEHSTKAHTDFVTSMEDLKSFSQESFKNIDNQIKEKEQEFYSKQDKIIKDYKNKRYDLEKEYEQLNYDLEKQFMSKRDTMERDFENDEYEKAVKVVKAFGEVNVRKNEYDQLQKELENLQKTMDKTIADARKDMEATFKREKEMAIRYKELEFKSISAEMKATIEQQSKEIASLMGSIENYKDEIAQQRDLTRSVAEAGKNPITLNSSSK